MSRLTIHHPRVVLSVILCAVTVFLYSFSMGHNFLFDESDIILFNPVIRSFSQLGALVQSGFFQKVPGVSENWEQYYRPVTLFTFMLDFQLWKTNPFGYNLTNMLLQCGVTLLLFQFLYKIFSQRGVAFFAALLFAVHPIHTESVTYIASRGDVLSGLFLLSALLLYWNRRLTGSLLCYTVALFCKESSLLFPIYILLLDLAFLRREDLRCLLRKLAPFVFIAAAYLVFRKTLCPIPMGPPSLDLAMSFKRVLSMGAPFLSYFQALIFPEPFKFCDKVVFAERWTDPKIWMAVAVIAGVFALWTITLRRWALRSQVRRAAFFGLSLFCVSLAPSLQFVPFFPQWAEHYLYVPSMGLTILFACLIREVVSRPKRLAWAAATLIYAAFVIFFSYRTIQRNQAYQDTQKYYTLLSQSASPYAYYGLINLALADAMNKSWDAAYVNLKAAYLANPKSQSNNYNLGLYWMSKKQYRKAYDFFMTAYNVESGFHKPQYLMNAGKCEVAMGRYPEAIELFEKVHQKLPKETMVYKQLNRAHLLAGQPQEALAWLERGLAACNPKVKEYYSLVMEKLFLAYLNDWDQPLAEAMESLANAEKISKGPDWYTETLRLFQGKKTVEDYQQFVSEHFPYNRSSVPHLILISHVLQKRWAELSEYLDEFRKTPLAGQAEAVFTKMIMTRAEQALQEHLPRLE